MSDAPPTPGPEAGVDKPAPSRRRFGEDRAAAAAARLTLANRRAAWQAGVAPGGRVAGRIAQGLAPLAVIDPTDPALVPIVDPARGERIIAAATAALAGHAVLQAITNADRARADQLVTPEARRFAARHPQLALPADGLELHDALARARDLAAGAWRSRLPTALAAECPDHPAAPRPAEQPPADTMDAGQPTPAPDRAASVGTGALILRRLRGRRAVVLPVAAGLVPLAQRPAAAVDLALAEIGPAAEDSL